MESTALNRWVFATVLVALAAAVLLGPLLLGEVMGLDARTPANAAYETLHDDYGLRPLSSEREAMKVDDGPESLSQFSLTAGSTTPNVPFMRDGIVVHCSVHVPSDPAETTADCS